MSHPPPTSTLFPYTTLFRSDLLLARLTRRAAERRPERQRTPAHAIRRSHPRSSRDRGGVLDRRCPRCDAPQDRKSTRLNSSHLVISYAVFCLKKKNNTRIEH